MNKPVLNDHIFTSTVTCPRQVKARGSEASPLLGGRELKLLPGNHPLLTSSLQNPGKKSGMYHLLGQHQVPSFSRYSHQYSHTELCSVMNWNDEVPTAAECHAFPLTFNSDPYDGFILFFEWVYFCFLMQRQDIAEGQVLSCISIPSSTPWWGIEGKLGLTTGQQCVGEHAWCAQLVARAPTSMPAMQAPHHTNNAFTLELPPGSNYSRPRIQLLVKYLGYSLSVF